MLDLKMNQAQQSGTALLYNATGQPVAISLPPRSTRYESYKNKESMIAGVILISAGILSIIFNAIGITLHEAVIMDGEGIWIGVMFIIAGAFGAAAATKNRCLVIAYMVLAIIAASLAALLFSTAMLGIFIGGGYKNPETKVGIMCALLAVTAVTAASVAIWGSVLGCKVTCCGRPATGVVVGTDQPVVIFAQQPYFSVAHTHADPMVTIGTAGAPPTYMSSVGNSGISSQQQQPVLMSQTGPSAGCYSGTAAALLPPSVHDADDTMLTVKI